MKFYSTNNKNSVVSFADAVIEGLPTDRGLYMPESFPKISIWDSKEDLSFTEIAYNIARPLIGNSELSNDELSSIIKSAFNFPAPITMLPSGIGILELFHGPTLAFKDFGARFMARTLSHFVQKRGEKLTILVATSGDTGSAVGSGFHNVPNIDVVILYPAGKISKTQEQQLTTFDGNVKAVEVNGTFDDCQRMVKEAFLNETLKSKMKLSSANSINIARLIPQSFYYANSYFQFKQKMIFAVPSGNFGNLTAGLFAYKMGLPVEHFIAATNVNHIVPDYLLSGVFAPKKSIATISNAMDVGDPSNFARMKELFTYNEMKKLITGYWLNEDETKTAMNECYQNEEYLIDPHGAIAWEAARRYQKQSKTKSPIVALETAHPAKFAEVVEPVIKTKVTVPKLLEEVMTKKKVATVIGPNFSELADYLTAKA